MKMKNEIEKIVDDYLDLAAACAARRLANLWVALEWNPQVLKVAQNAVKDEILSLKKNEVIKGKRTT